MFWRKNQRKRAEAKKPELSGQKEISAPVPKESKGVEPEEKREVGSDTSTFTAAEMQQRIEALSEPGSTVFFFLATSATRGGPLGAGAAVVELNPNYPGKKQKRYILYRTDLVDMQPVGKGQKLWDTDKAKDIAVWIKDVNSLRRG